MVRGLEPVMCGKSLREQVLLSLERAERGLMAVFHCLERDYREDGAILFSEMKSQRARGSRHKLQQARSQLDGGKNLFTT